MLIKFASYQSLSGKLFFDNSWLSPSFSMLTFSWVHCLLLKIENSSMQYRVSAWLIKPMMLWRWWAYLLANRSWAENWQYVRIPDRYVTNLRHEEKLALPKLLKNFPDVYFSLLKILCTKDLFCFVFLLFHGKGAML